MIEQTSAPPTIEPLSNKDMKIIKDCISRIDNVMANEFCVTLCEIETATVDFGKFIQRVTDKGFPRKTDEQFTKIHAYSQSLKENSQLIKQMKALIDANRFYLSRLENPDPPITMAKDAHAADGNKSIHVPTQK